jgi:hypothetical protein
VEYPLVGDVTGLADQSRLQLAAQINLCHVLKGENIAR